MYRQTCTSTQFDQCIYYSLSEKISILTKYEPQHEIPNNVVCVTSKGSDQPVHMHSLIRAFASCLNIL